MPDEASVAPSLFLRALAMNSGNELAGLVALATRTSAVLTTSVTGAKSRTGS